MGTAIKNAVISTMSSSLHGRHRRSACLAVALLSLGAAVAAQSPQLPLPGLPFPMRSGPNTGAISGTVTDATTGQPVAGAVVTLAQVRENALEQVPSFPRMVTDSRGRFVFRDLPESANYYLGARRFGYSYTRYGWTAPNGPLTIRDISRIVLRADQWIDNINIPLWRLGSIRRTSGRRAQ